MIASSSKIVRLSERIEALAVRRWSGLTLKSLTPQGWEKIKQLAQKEPVERRGDCSHWTDEALLRFLLQKGALTAADFTGVAQSGD